MQKTISSAGSFPWTVQGEAELTPWRLVRRPVPGGQLGDQQRLASKTPDDVCRSRRTGHGWLMAQLPALCTSSGCPWHLDWRSGIPRWGRNTRGDCSIGTVTSPLQRLSHTLVSIRP